MHTIKGYKDEWRIQEYLLLTFFISWLSWGILILVTALKLVPFMSPLGICLFIVGGFGPTLSALICIEGKLTWKKFKDFLFGRKKKSFWFFLLFAVAAILVIGLSSFEINPETPWYALPIVFLVCALFGGGNEELGWRGILQPVLMRFLSKHIKRPLWNYICSMLIIGVIWTLWHVPLWFVTGSTQQNIPFYLFAISTILLTFWLGCVYIKTQSVFYCMLLHGLMNVLMSFFIIKINWLLTIGFIIVTAISVVLAIKPAKPNLTKA